MFAGNRLNGVEAFLYPIQLIWVHGNGFAVAMQRIACLRDLNPRACQQLEYGFEFAVELSQRSYTSRSVG